MDLSVEVSAGTHARCEWIAGGWLADPFLPIRSISGSSATGNWENYFRHSRICRTTTTTNLQDTATARLTNWYHPGPALRSGFFIAFTVQTTEEFLTAT